MDNNKPVANNNKLKDFETIGSSTNPASTTCATSLLMSAREESWAGESLKGFATNRSFIG
jgi:hypothetical protein